MQICRRRLVSETLKVGHLVGCNQKLKWQANMEKRRYVSWFVTMSAMWIYYVEIGYATCIWDRVLGECNVGELGNLFGCIGCWS